MTIEEINFDELVLTGIKINDVPIPDCKLKDLEQKVIEHLSKNSEEL
jgi:hypothetical protein